MYLIIYLNNNIMRGDKEYGLFTKIKRSEEFLRKQVDYLLTVPQPEQRTEAWYRLREGRLTASDLATALNESKYDKPIDLILKKCGLGHHLRVTYILNGVLNMSHSHYDI